MRSSQSTATWFFERAGLDDALLGDLVEERAQGRSAVWYWRQVTIALGTGIWSAIRDHKVLAVRAVVTGFAMELLFLFLWNEFSPLLPDWPMLSWQCSVLNFSLMLSLQGVTGWVVGRTHRAHPIPMVVLFLICDLIWWGQRSVSFVRIVLIGSMDNPEYLPYLAWYLVDTLFLAAGLLIGGALVGGPRRLPADSDQTSPSPRPL